MRRIIKTVPEHGFCMKCKSKYNMKAAVNTKTVGYCGSVCKSQAKKDRIAGYKFYNKTKKQRSKKKGKKRFFKEPKAPEVSFYESRPWLEMRYKVLREYGRVCALCKATEGQFHVDHIKPVSKHPELRLCFSNLQVLCWECNMGKSNQYTDDWRPVEENLKNNLVDMLMGD